MVGTYETKGEMVMAPGQPMVGISGTDVFSALWNGQVVHGRTDGKADGSPMAYESHAFWGWDGSAGCMRSVWVDNMGSIGEMELRWSADVLIGTSAAMLQGQPTVQRFLVEFDEHGACKGATGHTIMGTLDPFLSFRSTYAKKEAVR